jgi:F0F1-type ATP synthase assembly protein I
MDGGSRDPITGRPAAPAAPVAEKPATTGRQAAVSGGEFAGIGLQFAFVIMVFTAAGVWLDGRLKSSPWFTITGVFLGAGGGFYSMYRKVIAAQRRDARERSERSGQRGRR